MKEQLAEEKYPTIFAFTLAERDGVCLSFRSHDVCCQLGTAGRWFAVAASANVNHCYLAGLGNGSHGSRLLLGMHWPRDLVVATLISWALVAVATWLAQRICGPLTPPAEENREIAQREQES